MIEQVEEYKVRFSIYVGRTCPVCGKIKLHEQGTAIYKDGSKCKMTRCVKCKSWGTEPLGVEQN